MHPQLTLANMVTVTRIVMTPFAAIAVAQKCWSHALILSLCAFFTDLIDGPCARWWNQVTAFGALLDAIADKLFMISMFGALLATTSSGTAPVLFSVLVKECTLVAGACYVQFWLQRAPLTPTRFGKLAIAFQLIFLTITCICHTYQLCLNPLFEFLLNSAVIFATVGVIADYARTYSAVW